MKTVKVTTKTYDNGAVTDIEEWEMNVPETKKEWDDAVHISKITYGNKVLYVDDSYTDDPIEIVMNMTDGDPLAELTLDDAAVLISEAEVQGYSVPDTLTPEAFLEIYEDLKPEAEK